MTAATDADHMRNVLGAFALVAGERVQSASDSGTGSTTTDTAALLLLTTTLDGASQDALARSLGLTPSGAARLVDRLVRDGLVVREAGADRRTFAVRTTRAGRKAARAGLDERATACAALVAALTAAERRALTPLLEKMLRAMPASRPDAHRICRLCDPVACGDERGRCPVSQGLDARGRGD